MSVVHLPQPKSAVEIAQVSGHDRDRGTEVRRANWWSRLLQSQQPVTAGQPGLEAVQRLELRLRGAR